MKRKTIISYGLFAVLLIGIGCSSPSSKNEVNNAQSSASTTGEPRQLPADKAEAWYEVIRGVKPETGLQLDDVDVTDSEYAEIKTFTDNLVKGLTEQKDVFRHILSWVRRHIKHENSDNRPYAVLQHRKGVCQGYASLLKVMSHTQGIPVMIVNGEFYEGTRFLGGHAWSCSYVDGAWHWNDPTNSENYEPVNTTGRHEKCVYIPHFMASTLHEDDSFVYTFHNGSMNIKEVKKQTASVTIPDTVLGYRINAMILDKPLSTNVKELKFGRYLYDFGEEAYGLSLRTEGVERVTVDEGNEKIESDEGIVYLKSDTRPYYIPEAMRIIRLRPVEKTDKNWLSNHAAAEEVWFHKDSKEIAAYTVEYCPKLKTIHVPQTAKVDEQAFMNNAPDTKVVRF